MAAYAEGLAVLKAANVGQKTGAIDAETTPLRDPEHYRYDLNLAEIAEVWRRGSVISSWLLDLGAAELAKDPQLRAFSGFVEDSGEGRWTAQEAIELGVPIPVISGALMTRDALTGSWRTQPYETNRDAAAPPNRNWFRLEEFVSRVSRST